MKKLVTALGLMVSFTVQAITIEELEKTTPSELSPYGELAEMFNFGSKNTDLQRDIKLKEIAGKVVQWKLPVYEVEKDGDIYLVRTNSSIFENKSPVDTKVYLTVRNEKEKKLIEAIKTDDIISFKGVISENSSRSLKISPATFYLDGTAPAEPEKPVEPQANPKPETETYADTSIDPAKVAEQGKSWQGDWGNGIIAIVSSDPCQDNALVSHDYTNLMTVSIPIARLKKPADAWQVSDDRATTITGCWSKMPDNMIHANLSKKNGKTWEQNFKMDDGNWTTTTKVEKKNVVGCIAGDCVNGQGTMTSPDGYKYVGEFKNDKPNGQGTLTSPDGSKWVGEWKGGKPNGQGTVTLPDGRKYIYEWKDGEQNGQGTMTLSDGSKYNFILW